MEAEYTTPRFAPVDKNWNKKVAGTTAPLTKLGTVVVTVARIFVPNCSEALVTNTAQYPLTKPRMRQSV